MQRLNFVAIALALLVAGGAAAVLRPATEPVTPASEPPASAALSGVADADPAAPPTEPEPQATTQPPPATADAAAAASPEPVLADVPDVDPETPATPQVESVAPTPDAPTRQTPRDPAAPDEAPASTSLAAVRADLANRQERSELEAELARLKTTVVEQAETLHDVRTELVRLKDELVHAQAPAGGPLAEVHFERASAELTPGARVRAAEAAAALTEMQLAKVRIIGHTDRVGDAASNEALSRERARSVATFLVDSGLDPALIEIAWMGESAPPIDTPDGVAEPLNRCVGIVPVLAQTTAAN